MHPPIASVQQNGQEFLSSRTLAQRAKKSHYNVFRTIMTLHKHAEYSHFEIVTQAEPRTKSQGRPLGPTLLVPIEMANKIMMKYNAKLIQLPMWSDDY